MKARFIEKQSRHGSNEPSSGMGRIIFSDHKSMMNV